MAGKTPLGHLIAAHHLFGWCRACADRDVVEEANAWVVWAGALPEVTDEIRRQQGGESSA